MKLTSSYHAARLHNFGSSAMPSPCCFPQVCVNVRGKSRKIWLAGRESRRDALSVRAVIEKADDKIGLTTVHSIPTTSVLGIILGGGTGDGLAPLTQHRAAPAISFGGGYRLVDVPLSNAINSGISKIYIFTQYNSQSLNRHVARTYQPVGLARQDAFIEILAAQQTPQQNDWFKGTADAIRQFSFLLEDVNIRRRVQHVVVMSADQLYRMNYMRLVQHHIRQGADVTIACTPVDAQAAQLMGVITAQPDGRITRFVEKPDLQALQGLEHAGLTSGDLEAAKLDGQGVPVCVQEGRPYLGSMGVYCFHRHFLLQLLKSTAADATDFGRDIIPQLVEGQAKVFSYLFDGYYKELNSIKSFLDANLEIATATGFQFFDPKACIFSSTRVLPPAKLVRCKLSDACIGHGSYLEQCEVDHAVVGVRSRVGQGTIIRDTMTMGADYYESDAERELLLQRGRVPLGIGERCVISSAILDKNVRIGAGSVIVNKEGVSEGDLSKRGMMIRDGIVVVGKAVTIPPGTEV